MNAQNPKFKIGKKVRAIVSPNVNVAYQGKEFTLKQEYHDVAGNWGWYVLEGNIMFYNSQLELVETNKEWLEGQIADKKQQIDCLKEKIEVLQSQWDYLDQTGQKELDDNEFKAYHTLKVLDDNPGMSILDKAKKIAELFKM